jgi:hypothetical protein
VSASAWIALAAVGATAISIIAAFLNERGDRSSRERNSEREREHVERLARANRHYASRLDAYREAGRQLARAQLFLQRTHPTLVVGEPPKRPPDFRIEELEAMSATINTAASQEALDALFAAAERVQAFQGRVLEFEQLNAQRPNSSQALEARQLMGKAREVAYGALNDAQKLMREELAAL